MQFANIKWDGQQPYSLDFDDIYYALGNGLAETEYVFIQHNQLGERFAAMAGSELSSPIFTIIETGFGTGLNFFCAVQCFLNHAPANANLRFISIEHYPLTQQDFIKANQNWPMFNEQAKQLHSAYQVLKTGFNAFKLCNNRIILELWVDDASECLPKIQKTADAWFLDGFAPSKNSVMWSEKLFADVSRLSKPNTTFSTFTSAGTVRRGLQAAGFQVNKVEGFGKKREMLSGIFLEQSC